MKNNTTTKCIRLTISLIIAVLSITFIVTFVNVDAYTPREKFTIVLDAGHGGMDGGVVGKITGKKESDTNLEITYKLREVLRTYGLNVILTRSSKGGLYSQLDGNKKRSDMEKRREIIRKSKADLVVSVHINKYSDSNRRGAQTFFQKGNVKSSLFAKVVQDSLNDLTTFSYSHLAGDYFILKCSQAPSIIVECGFFSNAQDERLLVDDNYQQQLVDVVAVGIISYMYLI